MRNKFKGYATFNEVEDRNIRTKNQAIILSNIFEDNLKEVGSNKAKVVSPQGASLVIQYFKEIRAEDKQVVLEKYGHIMIEKGFKELSNV